MPRKKIEVVRDEILIRLPTMRLQAIDAELQRRHQAGQILSRMELINEGLALAIQAWERLARREQAKNMP